MHCWCEVGVGSDFTKDQISLGGMQFGSMSWILVGQRKPNHSKNLFFGDGCPL